MSVTLLKQEQKQRKQVTLIWTVQGGGGGEHLTEADQNLTSVCNICNLEGSQDSGDQVRLRSPSERKCTKCTKSKQ